MFDAVQADAFMNKLFMNNLPHIQRIKTEAQDAITPVAVMYAESNNPAHRNLYIQLRSRVDTVRKWCAVMLGETATTDAVRQEIYKIFPDLAPDVPTVPAVKGT